MPTVKLGSPLKHALSVGDSVSVNGASTVEVISGGPYSITTVSSSQTFGPYGAPVTLRITSTSGDVAVTETNAPVLSTSDVVVDGAGSLRRKDDGSTISPTPGSGSVAVNPATGRIEDAVQRGAVAEVSFVSLAQSLDEIIVGTITRDANGAAISATLAWPDGGTGVYTATQVSAAFPGAVDAYTCTHVKGGVTRTYTQPAVTRDANGAVTNKPAMTVA